MKERRRGRRFPIECPVNFRTLSGAGPPRRGRGSTVNIGSRGVLLEVDHPVAEGVLLEVSMEWPAKLDQRSDLKLIMCGSVIRSEGTRIAVTIQKHEFRTMGHAGLFVAAPRSDALPKTAVGQPARRLVVDAAGRPA